MNIVEAGLNNAVELSIYEACASRRKNEAPGEAQPSLGII
jgi:hypothetical protein